MKTKKEERAIIFRAVNEAVKKHPGFFGELAREDIARKAAIIANRRGMDVVGIPYQQDILIEALDKKQKEGAFKESNHA